MAQSLEDDLAPFRCWLHTQILTKLAVFSYGKELSHLCLPFMALSHRGAGEVTVGHRVGVAF